MYLKEDIPPIDSCPLKWWKDKYEEFPNLARVARAYLCIPATQCSSERFFSVAGNVVSEKRGSLLTEHVEEISYLHDNLPHLDHLSDEQ